MENIDDKSEVAKINFVDAALVLLKWKKVILGGTLITMIFSIVLFFFVFDLIYFSTATIKSSGKGMSMLMGLDGLGDLGGIGDLVGGGGSTSKELSYYMEIISSRRCLEPLIVKFGLKERDEFLYMEDAIKNFRTEKLVLDFDKLSGLLTIGVYDKNPELAKEMVDFIILELNRINIELSVLNARNNREFIEKRYYQSKEDLSKAEDTLKAFQQVYGVAPDLQIKAAAQSLFTIEAELKSEEVKLDVLRNLLSADQPEVKLQEAKINSLKNKISEIQNSTSVTDFLSLGNSPNIALSYIRMQREIEIQTKILTFILPLFEQAKIEEKRETPTVLVLDQPYIAERKSKPKRLLYVAISAFLSILLISFSILLYEIYFKKFLTAIKKNK